MTLHDFVCTIQKSGNIKASLGDIAIDLYQYSEIDLSDDTILAVLKGNREALCKQGWLDEQGFFQYFEERTISTWPEMQKDFSELDNSGIVDCNTTDRYKFYESLLAVFYDILRLVPVSFNDILLPQLPHIIGREKEIERVSTIFTDSNFVLIVGIGGIGKSSVALAYAHRLKDSDNRISQYITCENTDTLQSAINKLQFNGLKDIPKYAENAAQKNFENRITLLKKSMKRMLIVLDNLNRPFDSADRDALKKLTECGNHVRLLITSRSRLVDDKQYSVNLSALNDEDLLRLYAYHRFEDSGSHKEYITQHRDILMKLFSLVDGHTLLVTLLAKLPEELFVNEYEVYNRLVSGLPLSLEGMMINKDGEILEIPPEGLVKTLFDISDMTINEKTVMQYMSLMPPAGIEIKLFEELTKSSRKDILALKRKNWVILDEEKLTIRLHPLICETILSFDSTKPTPKNCATFIESIKEKLNTFEQGSHTWQILNQILSCVAENIYFRLIASSGILDKLEDYYREPLLFRNEFVMQYMNTGVFDGWEPQHTQFVDGDDVDNGDAV